MPTTEIEEITMKKLQCLTWKENISNKAPDMPPWTEGDFVGYPVDEYEDALSGQSTV